MPVYPGTRVRGNNAYGVTTNNPLLAGDTTLNSLQLQLLPAVVSPTQHAVIVLDPKRVFGEPEIVIVTAHTGLSTSATIDRAEYGTIARQHDMGTAWAHVAVDEDFVDIVTSATQPINPFIGQIIFETDTSSHRFYHGTGWDSSPPVGAIIAYGGAVAPPGWLMCDGTAKSRTTYAALFAAISTNYGVGDTVTTFNLPNLQGKLPVGRDLTNPRFDAFSDIGGLESVVLATTQIPNHQHGITDVQHIHNNTQAGGTHAHNISDPGHGHGLSGGNHSHAIDGDYGLRVVVTANNQNQALVRGGLNGGIQHNHGGSGVNVDFRQQDVGITDIDHENVTSVGPDGGSNLSVNGNGINIGATQDGNANAGITNVNAFTGLSQTTFSGGGLLHENMPPFMIVNYIIKI